MHSAQISVLEVVLRRIRFLGRLEVYIREIAEFAVGAFTHFGLRRGEGKSYEPRRNRGIVDGVVLLALFPTGDFETIRLWLSMPLRLLLFGLLLLATSLLTLSLALHLCGSDLAVVSCPNIFKESHYYLIPCHAIPSTNIWR